MTTSPLDAMLKLTEDYGVSTLDGAAETAGAGQEPDTQQPLIWRTAVDVGRMTPDQVDWVVEGMVVPGAITEISGFVKTGKTTLVGCLVRGVLNWFGGC